MAKRPESEKTRIRSPYDSWYMSLPMDVRNSDPALCVKHLELLLDGQVIDNKGSFWSSAIDLSIHTAAQLAEDLAVESEARNDQRYRAMFLLVALSPWSKSVERRASQLSAVLNIEPGNDLLDHFERMGLALSVIRDDALWRLHKPRIVEAVAETCTWAGVQTDGAKWDRRVTRKFAQIVKSALLEQISTPPI
jgi:hypothetical protein